MVDRHSANLHLQGFKTIDGRRAAEVTLINVQVPATRCLRRRDYAEALEAYVYATELNPHRAVSHQLAGMAKIALGSAEEAFEPLQEAIRLSPHDLHSADLVFCMGWAYWELERYPEALHSLSVQKRKTRVLLGRMPIWRVRIFGWINNKRLRLRSGMHFSTNPTGRPRSWKSLYPLRPASLAALVEDLRKAGLPDQSPSV